MSKSLVDAIMDRRTIYHLGNQPDLTDQRIIELISLAVKNVPSAFNNQSQRVVILFNKHHNRLWEIISETLKARLSPERFPATEQRLKGFAAGYATILYFDDTQTTQEMMTKFPTYKDYFPTFALQAN
ncbi:MAG: nitroreductase family protein, partial [Victivallaceae bacterium]